MNERDTDEHGFSRIVSVFIRANPCPIFEGDGHEWRLNTMKEKPQISQMTQIFLCTFAPLRLCVKLFSEE